MSETSTPSFGPAREPTGRNFPIVAIGIAGALVAVVVGAMVALGGRHHTGGANQPLPLAPYADSLSITQLAMSESTSLSGGKSTFLDGQITNNGRQTVSAATVQVFFKNEEGMPPYVETLPVSLIRTHEPYVDTQPLSTAPLLPGASREFRLIFESIPGNWDTQTPVIHIVHVTAK